MAGIDVVDPCVGRHEGAAGQRQSGFRSKSVAEAAPGPVLRALHEVRGERIAFHVATDSQQGARRLDRVGLETPLVDGALSDSPSPGVEAHGVGSCYPMHES